jgi:hypothetical protein
MHHAASVKHLSYFDFYRLNRSAWVSIQEHICRISSRAGFVVAFRQVFPLNDAKFASVNRSAPLCSCHLRRLGLIEGKENRLSVPKPRFDVARLRWPILPRLNPVFSTKPLMLRGPCREQI